jgi:hypothetical protein
VTELNPVLRRNMRVERSSILTLEDLREALGLPADAVLTLGHHPTREAGSAVVEDRPVVVARWTETETAEPAKPKTRAKGQQPATPPPQPENKGQGEGSDNSNQPPATPPAEDMP